MFGLADTQGAQAPATNLANPQSSQDRVDQIKAILKSRTNGAQNGRLVQRPFDTRIAIRPGDEGTEDTIKEMARQAVLGSRDLIVRLMARDILEGIPGRDHESIAKRVFYWMQDRGSGEKSGVKFHNDAWRTEQVRAPWLALTVSGDGDCNSAFATTTCALLLSVGVPCFFRTVAADPERKDSFSHVYAVASVRGRDLALDSSVPFSEPGSEPQVVFKKRDWKIPMFTQDDWGRSVA